MASSAAPTTNLIKSALITNLDASPIVRSSVGVVGGVLQRYFATVTPAASQATSDLIRMVRVPSNAIIQSVRLLFDTEPTTAAADVGVWYSDTTMDGTSVTNVAFSTAATIYPISGAFFASAIDISDYFPSMTAAFAQPSDGTNITPPTWVDITFANATNANSVTDGFYIPSQSYLPLWQAMANSIALQTTPLANGAFIQTTQQPHFNTASGGTAFVRSDDPGGYFDICVKYTTTGSVTAKLLSMVVDLINPGV
jgi:hypothetical protein